ncbi:phage terminase large subunit [Gammaproteobacteria bacterium]
MEAKTLTIDINPLLFNNVYWHLQKAYHNEDIRFIWVYGGSSASKTFSLVQLQIAEMLSDPTSSALIMRKFAVDIKDSIFQDFKNIINDWGLTQYFTIQTNFIKCNLTGAFCRFRGLDDSEKVKGITGFKRVILEEISQFDEVDLKQIKKRLRGKKGQQIIGIFNPISEEHWLKTNVFDLEHLIEVESDISGYWVNKSGNTIVLKTNYLDNVYIVGRWKDGELIGGFVDQHVIADFEKDKETDNAYYQIYGLGNWGKLRTGGEFWKDFNPNVHIRTVKWNEDQPIHLVFDENINPYMTCLVWQISGKNQTQIDEICLPDPMNRRLHVCNEFIKRYPVARVKGLFIYGDRTSKKEDTGKEKGENFFTDIKNHLIDYKPTLRLQNVNPSVKQSGDFINNCFSGRIEINIIIGDNCKKSIYDYQYALEDSDGTIKKTKKTNPITKVSYEEFGHCSDALRYITTVAFADDYSKYLRGGRVSAPFIGKNVSKNSY